jgi:hypothetical protein
MAVGGLAMTYRAWRLTLLLIPVAAVLLVAAVALSLGIDPRSP